MIRRTTVVYIILLLGLAGAYYYLNNRKEPADISLTLEPTVEISYLFASEQGMPTSIGIESKEGQIVEVARGADNAWELVMPSEATADQAAAEAAASQITTMRILDRVPDIDPALVGLDNPDYVLTIKFTSQEERTVEIGVITPSESGYYVRDPEGKIVIISRSSIDSLLGLLSNPPYLETSTPSPTSTETPPATQTLPPTPTALSETPTP